jgi:hypothetical protein
MVNANRIRLSVQRLLQTLATLAILLLPVAPLMASAINNATQGYEAVLDDILADGANAGSCAALQTMAEQVLSGGSALPRQIPCSIRSACQQLGVTLPGGAAQNCSG